MGGLGADKRATNSPVSSEARLVIANEDDHAVRRRMDGVDAFGVRAAPVGVEAGRGGGLGPPRVRRLSAGVVLAFSYALYITGYLAINRLNALRPARVLFLPGEERLPLVPEFAPLYAAGFLLPILVIAFPPSLPLFLRLLRAFALTAVTAFAIFLAWPVALARPPVEGRASLLLRLAWLDQPGNCFPSLHVALACLFWLAFRRRVRWPGALLALVAGICVSTVLVKQHYAADILAGAVLAFAAWHVAGLRHRGPSDGRRHARETR